MTETTTDPAERRRARKREWAAANRAVNARNAKRYTRCYAKLIEMHREEYRDLVAAARADMPGVARTEHYRAAKAALRERHADEWADLLAVTA